MVVVIISSSSTSNISIFWHAIHSHKAHGHVGNKLSDNGAQRQESTASSQHGWQGSFPGHKN